MTHAEIEYAIRSFALDLLALSKELGVGAISVHVSPEVEDHYSGGWWERGKTRDGHFFEWYEYDESEDE